MDGKIILVTGRTNELEKICQLLSKNNYHYHWIKSMDQIEETMNLISFNCIIFDLDSIDVDNRTIRELTIKYPAVYFLCLSTDRFHPELKDAICYHIFACLTKPVDHDELLYWLRCIDEELDHSYKKEN